MTTHNISKNGITQVRGHKIDNPAIWMSDNATTKSYLSTRQKNGEKDAKGNPAIEPPRLVGILTDMVVSIGDVLNIPNSDAIDFYPKFKVKTATSTRVTKFQFANTYWACEVDLITPDAVAKPREKKDEQ
jgi:hypothetical protein